MPKKSTIDAEKVNIHIVKWLKDYALNAKVNGFVIGISGGVDSAVTSMLCAQTGLRLVCVEMPIHQDQKQVTRARTHITQLKERFTNVESSESDLTDVFDTFQKNVPTTDNDAQVNLAFANARARLRMTTLYYYAGLHGLLVAGTGNKVEDFGVGFFTKYGDGGVDLSPIADLMKSDIYALGAYLQVDSSILNAAPTDGLFGDDRTDEDQLGASYDEFEWAMQYAASGGQQALTDRQAEVLAIYKRLHAANLHKMNPIPVCIVPNEYL